MASGMHSVETIRHFLCGPVYWRGAILSASQGESPSFLRRELPKASLKPEALNFVQEMRQERVHDMTRLS